MDQGEPATLKQQEDMSIRGKSARHMVMQRLMGARGKLESTVLLLKNMVGAEDVDEDLQAEIEEECNKYGKVKIFNICSQKPGFNILFFRWKMSSFTKRGKVRRQMQRFLSRSL